MLTHIAVVAQLCVFKTHSSTEVHTKPSPAYPALQVHVNEPVISAHVESPTGQLCKVNVHSLMVAHDKPLPE